MAFSDRMGCEVMLSVQVDHVHLQMMVLPKLSISSFVGTAKSRTTIRILNQHRKLKRKPYWGNHFWAGGYCVDEVGLDEEQVRKYVRYQEEQSRLAEQQGCDY